MVSQIIYYHHCLKLSFQSGVESYSIACNLDLLYASCSQVIICLKPVVTLCPPVLTLKILCFAH
jgi:hypothetical protein